MEYFCVFCGTKISDGSNFCSQCGQVAVRPNVGSVQRDDASSAIPAQIDGVAQNAGNESRVANSSSIRGTDLNASKSRFRTVALSSALAYVLLSVAALLLSAAARKEEALTSEIASVDQQTADLIGKRAQRASGMIRLLRWPGEQKTLPEYFERCRQLQPLLTVEIANITATHDRCEVLLSRLPQDHKNRHYVEKLEQVVGKDLELYEEYKREVETAARISGEPVWKQYDSVSREVDPIRQQENLILERRTEMIDQLAKIDERQNKQ